MVSARPYCFRTSSASNSAASARKSASRPSLTSTSATDSRPPRLELANNPLQQRNKLSADPPSGVHHLSVTESLGQYARGHVRDARDAEHLDRHVTGHDGFGHSGHADGVGTYRSQVSDLSGRFVTGAQE